MMTDAAGEILRAELGAEPPPGLIDNLDADALIALAGKLREAKEHQSEALDRAIDDALGHLPRLLRMTVERILR